MITYLKILLFTLLPLCALSTHAAEFEWSELGLRVGIDAENRVNVKSYELIATLSSPWSWVPHDHFDVDLGFEFGVGALDGEGETGFLGHVGPSLKIGMGETPLELAVSSGPALLSEHEFDNLDLGGNFQFVNAVGFDLALGEDWTLGYRYLHISSAGLHETNPGMNLHAVNLHRKF